MRANNPKISARANESLSRRAASVALKKRIFIICSVLIASAVILLCSSILTFAKSNSKQVMQTEYKSLQIQSGDSLWSIAQDNTEGYNVEINDYIDQVKEMNQLKSDQIHSGQYLVVPIYHYSSN